jgi:hypothetical protein
LSAHFRQGLVRCWLSEVFFSALLAGRFGKECAFAEGSSGAAAFWADFCFLLLFCSFTLSIACKAEVFGAPM